MQIAKTGRPEYMREMFSRTEILLGKEAMEKLYKSRVAVFGIGGVGGYAAEALVRSGVGCIDVFDGDTVSESNLNRQAVATVKTLGMPKTEAFVQLAKDINPDAVINPHNLFYTTENADGFDLTLYDYVIDAIDMASAKTELIKRAKSSGVSIISCMGAGNKTDPARFMVADIYETAVCPLARVMRKNLKDSGIESLKAVYSDEPAARAIASDGEGKRPPVGSLATVVAAAGMLLANEVILDIIKGTSKISSTTCLTGIFASV